MRGAACSVTDAEGRKKSGESYPSVNALGAGKRKDT